MVNANEVKKGLIYTSPRWKGERQVTLIEKVVIEGRWVPRVDYIDLRTSRTGWATLAQFAAQASPKDLPAGTEKTPSATDPLSNEALTDAGLRLKDVPADARANYFVRVGKKVLEGIGFRTMLQADEWIGLHRGDFDWRGGNVFRLKGLRLDIAIVDREGIVLG